MKNKCDVSGDFPRCHGSCGCEFARKQTWADCDYKLSNGEICCNLAAIRAAIEAENHAMKCCGNCVRYASRTKHYKTGEIEYVCRGSMEHTEKVPWNVGCPYWEARTP